jgi:hypothetical protein
MQSYEQQIHGAYVGCKRRIEQTEYTIMPIQAVIAGTANDNHGLERRFRFSNDGRRYCAQMEGNEFAVSVQIHHALGLE